MSLTVSWMRRIDTWFGVPLAWILSLFIKKPKSLNGDFQLQEPVQRVIVAKFLGIGSAVLSLPLLEELNHSRVKVVFLSFQQPAEVVRLSGLVEEVWVVHPLDPFSILTFIVRAWGFKAQAYIDLEPTSYFSAIIGILTKTKMRIGYLAGKPRRERLFTHLIAFSAKQHVIENNLAALKYLNIQGKQDRLAQLPTLPANIFSIENIKRNADLRNEFDFSKPYIVINTSTSKLSALRKWPTQNWSELANQLLTLTAPTPELNAYTLLFTGSKEEQNEIDRLAWNLANPRVISIAGRTSLEELLTILSRAQTVITVDSGSMHLAAWVKAPIVALFGPETPHLYGPRSPHAKIIYASLPCSPCLIISHDKRSWCQDNQCMKKISPSDVFNTTKFLLTGESRAA